VSIPADSTGIARSPNWIAKFPEDGISRKMDAFLMLYFVLGALPPCTTQTKELIDCQIVGLVGFGKSGEGRKQSKSWQVVTRKPHDLGPSSLSLSLFFQFRYPR
jgi:hypothetical protein